MSLSPAAVGNPVVDAVCEDFEAGLRARIERFELLWCETGEAEPPCEQVCAKRARSNQFRQRPASGPQEHFEAERPVLSLAESECVPSIIIGLGFYVGDAVTVSPDENGTSDARHGKPAGCCRQPLPQQEPKQQLVGVHADLHGRPVHSGCCSGAIKPSTGAFPAIVWSVVRTKE